MGLSCFYNAHTRSMMWSCLYFLCVSIFAKYSQLKSQTRNINGHVTNELQYLQWILETWFFIILLHCCSQPRACCEKPDIIIRVRITKEVAIVFHVHIEYGVLLCGHSSTCGSFLQLQKKAVCLRTRHHCHSFFTELQTLTVFNVLKNV